MAEEKMYAKNKMILFIHCKVVAFEKRKLGIPFSSFLGLPQIFLSGRFGKATFDQKFWRGKYKCTKN